MLRADRLSCYKDQEEYKIHRQIYLADVTAVAALKDAKQPFSFGIFSKSKNFHFRAANEADTNDWTDKIWAAVANQVPEEDMMLSSPSTAAAVGSFRRRESMLMSSPPPESTPAKGARASMNTLDYSGPEVGSVSSFSDGARISQLSLSFQDTGFVTEDPRLSGEPQQITRNGTGLSSTEQLSKTVWHGFLYCLKSTGGIKQWKKYWIVVRNVNIGFYKNEEVSKKEPSRVFDSVLTSPSRNTVPSRYYPSKTSWTPSRLIRSPDLESTASKSSPSRKHTDFPHRTRKPSSRRWAP